MDVCNDCGSLWLRQFIGVICCGECVRGEGDGTANSSKLQLQNRSIITRISEVYESVFWQSLEESEDFSKLTDAR